MIPQSHKRRYARFKSNAVKVARDAFDGLSGDMAVRVAYTALCEHPGLTAAQLEHLSHILGRAAHERARNDLS